MKIHHIDLTPNGFRANASRDEDGVRYAGVGYRHKSGLGLTLAFAAAFGFTQLAAVLGIRVMDLECNTHHRVLSLQIGLVFCLLTVSIGLSYGKRDEELIDSLNARLYAAREAFQQDSELMREHSDFSEIVEDNVGTVRG